MTRTCSSCLSKERREYYQENINRITELKKLRELEKPEVVMYNRIKARAKKRGLPFNLELSDIIIPDVCPIFKLPFIFGRKDKMNASLDRIIPELGYIKGNIDVISVRANSIKNDATPEELRKVADYVESLLKGGAYAIGQR